MRWGSYSQITEQKFKSQCLQWLWCHLGGIVLQAVTATYKSKGRRRIWISNCANVSIQQGKIHGTQIFWKLHGVSSRVTGGTCGRDDFHAKVVLSSRKGGRKQSSPPHPKNNCLKIQWKHQETDGCQAMYSKMLTCTAGSVSEVVRPVSLFETDNWKRNWIQFTMECLCLEENCAKVIW